MGNSPIAGGLPVFSKRVQQVVPKLVYVFSEIVLDGRKTERIVDSSFPDFNHTTEVYLWA